MMNKIENYCKFLFPLGYEDGDFFDDLKIEQRLELLEEEPETRKQLEAYRQVKKEGTDLLDKCNKLEKIDYAELFYFSVLEHFRNKKDYTELFNFSGLKSFRNSRINIFSKPLYNYKDLVPYLQQKLNVSSTDDHDPSSLVKELFNNDAQKAIVLAVLLNKPEWLNDRLQPWVIENMEVLLLHIAAFLGFEQIVSTLCECYERNSILESELQKTTVKERETSLHIAVKSARIEVVKKLCGYKDKFDINAKNEIWQTALYLAVKKEQAAIFEILLDNSAVEIEDSVFETALSNLFLYNNLYNKGAKILQLLYEKYPTFAQSSLHEKLAKIKTFDKANFVLANQLPTETESYEDIKKSFVENVKNMPVLQNEQGEFLSFTLAFNESLSRKAECEAVYASIKEKLVQEIQQVKGICEEDYQTIYAQDHTVYYRSKSQKPEKSVVIPALGIHSELQKMHDEQKKTYQKMASKGKVNTNFICAAITLITTSTKWQVMGRHKRQPISFFISGAEQSYGLHKAFSGQEQYQDGYEGKKKLYLQGIINRCMTSGSLDKTIEVLDTMHDIDSYGSDCSRHHLHSEQALFDFLTRDEAIGSVIATLEKHNIKQGYKIYGLVLDIYSTNPLCNEATSADKNKKGVCGHTVYGLQNSHKDKAGFLYKLCQKLAEKEYKLPEQKNATLNMITRYSSDKIESGHMVTESSYKSVEDTDALRNFNTKENNHVILCRRISDAKENQVLNQPHKITDSLSNRLGTLFYSGKDVKKYFKSDSCNNEAKKRTFPSYDSNSKDAGESPSKIAKFN
jgi:hypothetical protein